MEWNDTAEPYPDATLPELFGRNVALFPDAVAVDSEQGRLTYGQLDSQANRVAWYLRERGVGPEALVGLCVDRSPSMIVGMLGVLKAGGAYLPLDPGHPERRLRFSLDDAGAVAVLASGRHVGLPAFRGRPLYDLESVARGGTAAAESSPPGTTTPAHLAYVMYTSGSTGTPKGVEVSHRAVVRLVHGQRYATFGPDRAFLLIAPITFDASVFEIWAALLHGGRCVLYPEAVPYWRTLRRTIAAHGVTSVHLTTTVFNQVIDQAPETLAGVSEVFFGGEACSTAHVTRALSVLTGCRLIQFYGPTEGTAFTTFHLFTRGEPGPFPIGRPLANTRAYVLDPELDPTPVGEAGELYVGGDGLARGYRARPRLTAAAFVPDPFRSAPGARLYRTGDRARYRADGNIEFLGRWDDQIKIRGMRVELGEVEAALLEYPDARQAAVVTRGASGTDLQLVAYVVPANGGLRPEDLKEFMRVRVPAHMVPSYFVLLDALPTTSHGKVDRRALPGPDGFHGRDEEDSGDTSEAGVQATLASIWARVLKRGGVGTCDNFFDLGGHSLLAAQVVSDANDMGIEITLMDMFETETLGELVQLAEERSGPAVSGHHDQ